MSVVLPPSMPAVTGLEAGLGSAQVGPVRAPEAPSVAATDAPPAGDFATLLEASVREAAGVDQAADAKAVDFARGRLDDLHGTMIATKKAEISLHLVGQVRNKLLDAFQELWRINV